MIRIFSQYVSSKTLLLAVLEGGLILLALLCGARLRFWSSPADFESFIAVPAFVVQAVIFLITFEACFYYSDLYDLNIIRNRRDEWISLGQSLGAGCLCLGVLYFVFPVLLIGRGVFFISTALIGGFVSITRWTLDTAWQVAAPKQNILILGSGELALTVARELARRDDLNVRLAGFLEPNTPNPQSPGTSLFGHSILGTVDQVDVVAAQQQISRIVVAMENRRGSVPIRELVRLRVHGIRIEDAHTTVSSLTGRIWLHTVQPSWFVFSEGFHRSRLTLVVKRIVDLGCGLAGLLLSSPLMLLVALAVRLDSKGPVIFRQARVGLQGKCFEVLKFRSMRVDAETGRGAQWARPNDDRVTRVGRYLRKFRLDELPQFVNVIRGEMSFVGPRPERPFFVDQLRNVIAYYEERHSVRPGLTGWAQVQYAYGASIEDAFRKLEYDLFYVKNMSMLFDFAIILKTIRIIISGRGGR